jgi:hypothetical protein
MQSTDVSEEHIASIFSIKELKQEIRLTLKTEATCCSETSVEFQGTTRRYIPEDRTLHTTAVRTLNPACL